MDYMGLIVCGGGCQWMSADASGCTWYCTIRYWNTILEYNTGPTPTYNTYIMQRGRDYLGSLPSLLTTCRYEVTS